MRLPFPKPGYNQRDENERNRQIEQADQQNHKRNRDVEIGNGRLIVIDETTGTQYQIYVDSGTLSIRSL